MALAVALILTVLKLMERGTALFFVTTKSSKP
jgi:hypothetical protein